MKLVEMANVLNATSKIYEEAGNEEIASGILTFSQLLRDCKVGTVTAFVTQLKSKLSQQQRDSSADI
jgi:hypothetical protein